MSILAFLLVLALPALTLYTATRSLGELAKTGADTAVRTRDAVTHARELHEAARAMERHARQAAIMEDTGLTELYLTRRRGFGRAADRLSRLAMSREVQDRLDALLAIEQDAHRALTSADASAPLDNEGLTKLAQVEVEARSLVESAEDAVYEAASTLEAASQRLGQEIVLRGVAVLPLLVFVLFAGYALIILPLRRLGNEIRRIGEGSLDHPVVISGPSDVRHLGARLEDMRRQLKQVEADRVRLYRHVSHELKTPLASIREGAELLAEGVAGPLDDQQAEIVNIIRTNSLMLHRRIEDLIRLSELRTQDAPLALDRVDLGDLVSRLIDQHQLTARGRRVLLECDLPSTIAMADSARLPAAIDNLLTNALKVAPPDTVVSIGLRTMDDAWELHVTDQGPGVPVDERERVFEPFYQGKRTRTEYVQGTGIGLTISREIVRAHGGDVLLQDNPVGPGTRAVIRAPLQPEVSR